MGQTTLATTIAVAVKTKEYAPIGLAAGAKPDQPQVRDLLSTLEGKWKGG